MRRTVLTFAARGIGLMVAGLLILPLVLSLAPSNAAKAARSQHDVGSLMPGDFRFEPVRYKEAWPAFRDARGEPGRPLIVRYLSGYEHTYLLLLRDWGGRLHAYRVPFREGRVNLPERYWWMPSTYWQCERFGPQVDADGRLLRDGVITCHDEALQALYDNPLPWRWSYEGNLVDERFSWVPPLEAADVELDGETLYVNR